MQKEPTILKPLHFCKFWKNREKNSFDIGIANAGYFASTAWIESDEAYDSISGQKFGWYDPEDNMDYMNSKFLFDRPTELEILYALNNSTNLKSEAIRRGLIN
jgi:hypothetical protein